MAEKVVWIDYNASLEPPYKWEVKAIGEDGTELILGQGQGAWITAANKASDLRKMLGIRPNGSAGVEPSLTVIASEAKQHDLE